MFNDTLPAAPVDQPHIQWVIQAIQRILDVLCPMDTGLPNTGHRRAVRIQEALHMLGLKRSDFYSRQNPKSTSWDPTFPASFKLGGSPNSPTVWYADELEAWLAARAAHRAH